MVETLSYSRPTTSRRPGRPGVLLVLLVGYPVAMLACLYATWLVAWVSLGHRPIPSLNDPKSINAAVSGCHLVTGLLLMFSLPMLLLNIGGVIVAAAWRVYTVRRIDLMAALFVAGPVLSWAATVVVLRADPGRVLYWFMD